MRYNTVDEQLAILQALKAGEPIEARPLCRNTLLTKWTPIASLKEKPDIIFNFHDFHYRVKREPLVLFARIDNNGLLGSSNFDRKQEEYYQEKYGGRIVKFVEVIDGEATE